MRLLASALFLGIFSTCQGQSDGGQTKSAATGATGANQNRASLYVLKHGDVLGITFPIAPEFNQTVTITPDGYISLQATRNVYLEDFTLQQATGAIKEAYLGILHDPMVSVDLKDFQRPYFTILGQVGHPGKYDLRQQTSLAEAIAVAGGITATGKTQVFLIRRVVDDKAEVTSYQMSSYLEGKATSVEPVDLKPGDMIFVPEKFITKFKKYITYGSIGGINGTSLY
jgi:polysaccharide export outer membrane protein